MTTDMISPATTRILVALLAEYETVGRVTVDTVAARAGRSRSTTYKHLWWLRNLALVEWEDGTRGTLRPTVRRLAV